MSRLEKKIFAATDENMGAVNDFIHTMIPENVSFGVLNQIDLAVEELYVNIAHYAYQPEKGDVEVECELSEENDNQIFRITFKDSGKPFDPLARKDPDITLSAEERGIGGLGIFLTKKFMDSVEYEYTNNCNVLTIKKTLSK